MLEYTYVEESRRHYHKLLQEGEAARRVLELRSAQPAKSNALLGYLGNWVSKSSTWLKQHNQTSTPTETHTISQYPG